MNSNKLKQFLLKINSLILSLFQNSRECLKHFKNIVENHQISIVFNVIYLLFNLLLQLFINLLFVQFRKNGVNFKQVSRNRIKGSFSKESMQIK